jgi:hypothetical protein
MFAFEHVDLLTQRCDFQSKAMSRAKESREPFKETPYQFEHADSLQGRGDPRRYHKSLVYQRNSVLATDTTSLALSDSGKLARLGSSTSFIAFS